LGGVGGGNSDFAVEGADRDALEGEGGVGGEVVEHRPEVTGADALVEEGEVAFE
jgi:hypothetical protein